MRAITKFLQLAVSAGLCVAIGSSMCRAADGPVAKPADLEKMTAALPEKAPAKPAKARKVLVFGNANGFVHSSIPLGEETVAALGKKTGAFTATISNDPAVFDDLKEYDAVALVSTTGHFLLPRGPDMKNASAEEKKAAEDKMKTYHDAEKQRMQNLVDFVTKDGKGLIGIHAATDAYYDFKEYGDLIGGYFDGHPWTQGIVYKVDDAKSPITMSLKDGFKIDDETYKFKAPYSREHLHILTSIDDEKTKQVQDKPKDSRPDGDHAISWIRTAGKGRVFYCSHGHSENVYSNAAILQEYLAGIQYALGDLEADATPSKPSSAGAGTAGTPVTR